MHGALFRFRRGTSEPKTNIESANRRERKPPRVCSVARVTAEHFLDYALCARLNNCYAINALRTSANFPSSNSPNAAVQLYSRPGDELKTHGRPNEKRAAAKTRSQQTCADRGDALRSSLRSRPRSRPVQKYPAPYLEFFCFSNNLSELRILRTLYAAKNDN